MRKKCITDWQSDAPSTSVHSLHVHVGSEHSDFALWVLVCFHTLKDSLRIV